MPTPPHNPEPNPRAFALDVVRRLRAAGYEALWAGGCVRDELLGLHPKDYDVATDARPEEVRRLFRRTVAVGMSFGVVRVLGPLAGNPQVEVATFRRDSTYSDGRHPDAVSFADAREDALRRDFTINGMFFEPVEGRLIDYVGGQHDLGAKVLRAIGEPRERFAEDKLRMLRAVRFATRFELAIDPATHEALREMAEQIGVVSAERVADELRKLLVDPHRARGLELLHNTGLIAAVLPELLEMRDLPQGPPHAPTGDLWGHTMRVLELLGPDPSFPLAFAALLHDVGKRRSWGRTPDRYTFHEHERVGRDMAARIGLRLKLSNAEREHMEWMVEKHQYLSDAKQMRTSKLKEILAHPGVRELLALHRADALASGRPLEHVLYCETLLEEWSEEDFNPRPLLTGHDLTRMGLEPGPLYKRLLTALREAQLDGVVRSKAHAVELVRSLLAEERRAERPGSPSPPAGEPENRG
jgi:poly(A) polymerase